MGVGPQPVLGETKTEPELGFLGAEGLIHMQILNHVCTESAGGCLPALEPITLTHIHTHTHARIVQCN